MSKKLEEMSAILLKALTQKADLQELTRLASLYLGNPINVVSCDFEHLAAAGETVPDDTYWSLMSSSDTGDRLLLESITHKAGASMQAHAEFHLFKNGTYRILSCSDSISSSPLVYVHLIEYSCPITEEVKELLELFANLAAYVVLHANIKLFENNPLASATIAMLLNGQHLPTELAERRLFKNSRFQRYQVVVIEAPEKLSGNLPAHAVQMLMGDFPDSKCAMYEGRGVVVTRLQENWLEKKKPAEQFREVCARRGGRYGVSLPFGNILKLKEYYLQALKALDYGVRNNAHGDIFFYSDCALSHFFEIASEQFPVENLCDPSINYLLRYDHEYKKGWFKTIAVYYFCGLDVAEAAKALGIHLNTMKYRLQRIRSLVGGYSSNCILDDPFRLGLSLKALLFTKPSLCKEYGLELFLMSDEEDSGKR